ncbi:MAG: GTPase RsgA [Kiritimatiellae bacterium]|nr:GTPase RsgA [Kiritimatiellia bacterium]
MTTLERYGFTEERRSLAVPLGKNETYGRVTSTHGDYFHLMCNEADGEIIARKKASAFLDEDAVPPTTGDFVRFVYNPVGESRITGVVSRFATFERVDPSSKGLRTQTIAVNFDTLFFLMSVNENFSTARLERILELCSDTDCRERLVLVLSKCDLVDKATLEELLAQLGAYELPTRAISVKSGAGLESLSEYVAPGRTLALIGSSGVGKSSLVNALAGEEWMATQEIQSWSGKGRHTTTSRELVMLPSGAMVIDTPGMRELGILGKDGGNRFRSSGTHRFR